MTHCGYIAIVGRPNVGKSTLLNHLVNEKICITSRKPQTTQHQILGIKTIESNQMVFVDTPGVNTQVKKTFNRYLTKLALHAMADVDVVLWVIEGMRWSELEDWFLEKLASVKAPVFLIINKLDKIKDKDALLSFMAEVSKKRSFEAIIPVSAASGKQLDILEQEIIKRLPEGPHLFDPDQTTDRPVSFRVTETVREKIVRQLGQELPYALTVALEGLRKKTNLVIVDAVIYVERDSQKGIVLGNGGKRIKRIGTEAREDLEKFFHKKVLLNLWVKVKYKWTEDEKALCALGYTHRE